MRIHFCIISLCVLVFGCSKKEKRPDVLPEKKMREVMWDMIRADQYVADFVLKDSTRNRKNESIKLYEEIFRLHKISRNQFKRSLNYYGSRPDLFQPLLDSLAQRRNEFITTPPTTHRLPDSTVKPFLRKGAKKQ